RWLVSKRRVWPLGVVVSPPGFDDDLGLGEAVEDLTVKQFVAELRVEALAVAVLPRASWFDERCLCADGYDPLPYSLGDELRAVVGNNHVRLATPADQIGQFTCHPATGDRCIRDGCQTLSRDVIDDVEHPEPPTAGELVMHEVERPARIRSRLDQDWCSRVHCSPPCPALANRQLFLAVEP